MIKCKECGEKKGFNVVWNGYEYICHDCFNRQIKKQKEWEESNAGKLEIRCMDCNFLIGIIPVITGKKFDQITNGWKCDRHNDNLVVLVGNHINCDRHWRLYEENTS
jgi:hypothetical protein